MMTSIGKAIVTCVAAMAVFAASAPALAGQGVGGGLRADLGLASFRNEDADQSRRTGVRVGVFGELELPGPVDLLAEVVYANKGTKSEGADEALALDYVEIPVAVKVALGSSPVFLVAGPAFAFLVDSPFEDSDLVGDFDLGLLAGVGVDVPLGALSATFDVRYTTGFSTVFDFGPGDSDTDDRNQVLSFGVGLRLF